jgi:hypothetical protein
MAVMFRLFQILPALRPAHAVGAMSAERLHQLRAEIGTPIVHMMAMFQQVCKSGARLPIEPMHPLVGTTSPSINAPITARLC